MTFSKGLFFIAGLLGASSLFAAQYEQPVVLNASDILDGNLTSDNYRVESVVLNDGRFNLFSAVLNGQPARVQSNDLMAERMYEADAIELLREIKETDAYKKGLDAALEAPLTLTRKTLEDPVAMLESLPDGLSNLMQDIGAALGSAGKGESKGSDALVKDLIGFNTVKRRLAAELGVDVYSSNPVLQQELDDVAWSMFAGGAVIDVALMAAPLVASLTVRASDQANTGSLSWRVPPATLQQAIARAVKNNGLHDRDTEALVIHKTCSLNHLSSMVTNMTALGSVDGVDMFYRQVNALSSEQECRIHQKLAELIYLYHVNKQPVKRIRLYGYVARLTDVNDHEVLAVVADYLPYQGINSDILEEAKLSVWLSGELSPAAIQVTDSASLSIEQSVSIRYNAPLDIVQVLMPERANQIIAADSETNRTQEVVGGVTDGVSDVVGGVFGALTSPLTGGTGQHDNETNDSTEN